VQQYLRVKQESKVPQYSITKQHHLEFHVLQFGFDFFFIGVYREPLLFPHQKLVIVLWNWEFNLYKEQVVKMKHNLQGSNGNVASSPTIGDSTLEPGVQFI
jgi:hypothetical protein